MQVVMGDAGVVHARQQLAQRHGQTLPQTSAARLRPLRQCGFEEGIERPRFRQGARDEETVARSRAPAGFADGQRLEGRHLPRAHRPRVFVLAPRLARPYQFAQSGAAVGEAIVFQIEIQLRQDDMIDGAMRAVLDDVSLPRGKPFVQRQPIRSKQMFQSGTNLPADAAADEDDKLCYRVHAR